MVDDLEIQPRVLPLDWTGALRPPYERSQDWRNITSTPKRTIVAADVVRFAESGSAVLTASQIYDPVLVPALVATIAALLEASQCAIAVVAATVRNVDTLVMFESTCSQYPMP